MIHALDGQLTPTRGLVLGSGIGPIEIHRPDERTLLVRPEGGFIERPGSLRPGGNAEPPLFDTRYLLSWLDRVYRDDRPMRIGERIQLDYVTIEVAAVTDDGRPADVTYRFASELELPLYRWIQWDRSAYVAFPLPPVGETVTLPATTLP